MGREKGFIPYNRYTEDVEQLVKRELEAGKSYRKIHSEHGISQPAIRRIKERLNVVQPVKQLKPKAVTEKVKKEFNRESSHVTFSHIKWGDSFIYNSF